MGPGEDLCKRFLNASVFFKYCAARREPMAMPRRPTYRRVVADVPDRTGEMKYKCRQPARYIWRCVRGWRAPSSNCRNVGNCAGGVAERAVLKSEIYRSGHGCMRPQRVQCGEQACALHIGPAFCPSPAPNPPNPHPGDGVGSGVASPPQPQCARRLRPPSAPTRVRIYCPCVSRFNYSTHPGGRSG